MQASEIVDPSHPPDRGRAELVIRAARPGDCEAITALINLPGFRAGTLRLPHQSPEEVRKWLESHGAGSISIVALLDRTIVGKADLSSFPGRRSHAGMIGMGVHDGYRGRGIGTALLRELLDAADNWLGLKRIELTVFVDNAPAIALYERHGFRIEGTLAAYAFRSGAFVDAHAMARLR
jgi:putative acetyltransferase